MTYGYVPDGGVLAVRATVVNLGVFQAREFKVALVVAGETVAETVMSSLNPGFAGEAELAWTVGASRDDAWLVIDPGDDIVESNETNNLQMVEVAEAPGGEDGGSLLGWAGGSAAAVLLLLAVLAVVAVAALLVIRKRGKEKEVGRKARAPLFMAEIESMAVKRPVPRPAAQGPFPTPVARRPMAAGATPRPLASSAALAPRPLLVPKPGTIARPGTIETPAGVDPWFSVPPPRSGSVEIAMTAPGGDANRSPSPHPPRSSCEGGNVGRDQNPLPPR